MPRVFLSIGSNLGDRLACLRGAVARLRALHDVDFVDASPLYRTEPWGELVGAEKTPGEEVQGDAELDAYLRDFCYVGQHPVGTCAMGLGAMSVVDSELRVIGIEGLRVADASVMPTVPGGNTMLPSIMVGEKAADLIRGQSLPRAELPQGTEPVKKPSRRKKVA